MSKYIEYERLEILFRKITQPFPKKPSKPKTPLNQTFYPVPTRFGLERFHCIQFFLKDRSGKDNSNVCTMLLMYVGNHETLFKSVRIVTN